MTHGEHDEFHYLVRFGKRGAARYLSLHDVRRAWERAIRRAGLPLAYSRGFNPKPRLSFGPPLAVGAEGRREYMVVTLRERVDATALQARLSAAAIDGLPVVEVIPAARRKTRGRWAAYELRIDAPPEDLSRRVEDLLAARAVTISRGEAERRKSRDIRPGVLELQIQNGDRLIARLRADPDGMVTPRDLAAALGVSFRQVVRNDIRLADDA